MADRQTEGSRKDQGDKLGEATSEGHQSGEPEPLRIPTPEEHSTEGSNKIHGDKLESHDKN